MLLVFFLLVIVFAGDVALTVHGMVTARVGIDDERGIRASTPAPSHRF